LQSVGSFARFWCIPFDVPLAADDGPGLACDELKRIAPGGRDAQSDFREKSLGHQSQNEMLPARPDGCDNLGLMEPHSSHYIISAIVSGLAVLLTSKVVPGFEIKGFFTAVISAILIAVMNFLLWWVLFVLTLPINVLTFGLFTFVINGIILKICAALMPGFELRSWISAILGAIVLSLISTGLHFILAI
jgi:putative membrane protein